MRLLALTLLFSLAAAAEEPDVQRIHVLEQRPFTESGRWEVSFFGLRQVNPKFTVHTGLSAEVAVHLRENLAAQLGLTFFPIAVQSTLAEELLTKANESPTSAEAFLLRYAAVAGLELMPIYGKLDVLDGRILRLASISMPAWGWRGRGSSCVPRRTRPRAARSATPASGRWRSSAWGCACS